MGFSPTKLPFLVHGLSNKSVTTKSLSHAVQKALVKLKEQYEGKKTENMVFAY